MKFFKIILLIISICSTSTFTQWHWQNPLPIGKLITDLQFTDSLTGYACGYGGLFLKTTNGGDDWNEMETPINDLIISFYFLNNNIGWILSYNGHNVFRTTDGGLTWEFLSSFSPAYPGILYFLNEQDGYAIGYYNNIFRTSDGGSTWTTDNSITGSTAIYFLDNNRGFISTTNLLYRTVNGGDSWTPIDLLQLEFTPYKIYAYDLLNIYLVGIGDFMGETYNLFWNTSNGGISWDGSTFENQLTDVFFTAPNQGYICNSYILKTNNRGVTWDTTDFYALEFEFYQNKSWSHYYNTISFSDDGWNSSVPQTISIFSGYLYDCYAKDTNTVFSCGSNETILGTVDGGKNWEKYYSSENNDLNGITIHDDEIWAVGSNGTIVYSRDNGLTWNEKTINSNWLNDITFLSNGVGFIAGIFGGAAIFTSTDGGETWIVSESFPEFTSMDKIKFSQDDLGWAISYPGAIFKSTDYGNSWGKVIDSIYTISSVAVSGDTAWFSYSNKILRTTDAGESWQSFHVFDFIGSIFDLTSVDFINAKIGYESAYDGRVFKTTDGGETWSQENYPGSVNNYSLDFVNEDIGWVTGWPGTILKRDPHYINVNAEYNSKPEKFALYQNYPNPFNPVTTIRYSVPENSSVKLEIYDILGRKIQTLIDNEYKKTGEYEIKFNGQNLPSGVYIYRIITRNYSASKKMLLLK